jgi:FtsP/CotA-like multicopper oxidase with cupredoxin domain
LEPVRRSVAEIVAVLDGDDLGNGACSGKLPLGERFIWGFDGKKFSEAGPIELKRGDRVRFVLINDTMMEHPIHLHGLWSELENGHGEFRPYKHTINVKPGEKLTYLVTADEPGRWAYHCHLLYHMETGMFREVHVA